MFQKVIGQKSETTPPSPRPDEEKDLIHQRPQSGMSSPSPMGSPAHGSRNILSSDVRIKGSIFFTNDLVVDGRIEGDIRSEGILTVGENALIKATINTRSVVIQGKVYGNIEVTDKVELHKNAEVVGDIKAGVLVIEQGAVFVGNSIVGTPSMKAEASKSVAGQSTAASGQKSARS